MAEAIKNAFRALIRDIRSWNRPYEPPARDSRGIGRHFANVGKRLTSAAARWPPSDGGAPAPAPTASSPR